MTIGLRKTLLVVLLGWLPIVSAYAAELKPVLLILGDSLSAGYGIDVRAAWPQLLQTRLDTDGYGMQVVNASISGETTSGGLQRLGDLLVAHKPRLVVVELGANDGLRGIALPTVRRNLHDILAQIRAHGAQALVIKIQLPPNYGPAYTEQFVRIYDDLAALPEVHLAPFFMRDFVLKPAFMQADGLHPTAAAQPLMLDTIWPVLHQALKEISEKHSS